MTITAKEVFEVADRLRSEGTTPTNRLVRQALGGGSYSVITVALRVWREVRLDVSDPARQKLPPLTAERVNEAADRLEAEGRKPTNRAVLEALGGGRKETVTRLLRDRREARLREATPA